MSTSLKKLLLISFTLVFGVMNSSAYAQVTETITLNSGVFAGQSYSVTETGAPLPSASDFKGELKLSWVTPIRR